MSAEIHLVIGGGRSGKSRFALTLAESRAGTKGFVATSPLIDDEMLRRAQKHKLERSGRGWTTIEEETDLAKALATSTFDTLVVDCLTLWINNLMFHAQKRGEVMEEEQVAELTHRLIDATEPRKTVIFVTNEVGMSIVPENAIARHFRDLSGTCNQIVAAAANQVHLIHCGIPTRLK